MEAPCIRPMKPQEICALERVWSDGDSARHRRRFERQAAGEAEYLVPWDGSEPVGHVLLLWTGCADEMVRRHLDVA